MTRPRTCQIRNDERVGAGWDVMPLVHPPGPQTAWSGTVARQTSCTAGPLRHESSPLRHFPEHWPGLSRMTGVVVAVFLHSSMLQMVRSFATRLGVYLATATALALLFSGQYVLESLYRSRAVTLGPGLRGAALYSYSWAALAWPLYWMGMRHPVRQPHAAVSLTTIAAAGAACAEMQIPLRFVLARVLGWEPERTLWELTSSHLFINGVVALTIVCASQASSWHRQARDHERRRAELELSAAHADAELAQAQLQILRHQLHPHFLFNTLNAISALMHQDVEAADRTLGQLSELLRQALDSSAIQEWTLQEELTLLRQYLEIQHVRFSDRLASRITVEDQTKRLAVPPFMLQPLVENAIEHAVARRRTGGRIDIRATLKDPDLVIEIEDDGSDVPPTERSTSKPGLGLRNTEARLARLYGTAASLRVHAKPAGGAVAVVAIPARVM